MHALCCAYKTHAVDTYVKFSSAPFERQVTNIETLTGPKFNFFKFPRMVGTLGSERHNQLYLPLKGNILNFLINVLKKRL